MRYFIEAKMEHPTAELVEDDEGCLWRQIEDGDLTCPNCESIGYAKFQRVTDEEERCEECLGE